MIRVISKEKMVDLAKASERNEAVKKIEAYLDWEIEKNILNNCFTFFVPTKVFERGKISNTPFYDVWFNKSLSSENLDIVHEIILAKYKDSGFDISRQDKHLVWTDYCRALYFKNIDKIWKQEEEHEK